MMRTNQKGIELIKHFEQCRLRAYRDAVGVWTIGWGHTKSVKPGLVITQEQADTLLELDLQVFEQAVARAIGDAPTTEDQFAAMVSLAYNIGAGAFARSTVLRQHRAGHPLRAAAAFMLWVKAGGKTLRGLVRRRNAERRLYASGQGVA